MRISISQSLVRLHSWPVFFNIHLCDLFFLIERLETANYADDTSTHAASVPVADVE